MRGFGRNRGFGMSRGRYNSGDKPGSGPGGNCVCSSCGYTTSHTRFLPCNQRKCPKCGSTMTKE